MKRWFVSWAALVGFLVAAWAAPAPALAQERCPATKTGALSAQSTKQLGRLQNGRRLPLRAADGDDGVARVEQEPDGLRREGDLHGEAVEQRGHPHGLGRDLRRRDQARRRDARGGTGDVRHDDANGKATFTTGALATGNHNVIATYAGDGSFLTSASSTLVQSVGLQATTTILVSNKNPSRPGDVVVFTATVKPTTGALNPTGAVTFKDGTSTIGVEQVDNAGNTTMTTTALVEGTHTITATYDGDTVYGTSTSAALAQVVTKDTGSSASSSSGGSSTSSSSGASSGTSGTASSSGDVDAGDDKEGAAVIDNAGGCGCRSSEASGSGASGLSGLALVAAAVAIATRRRRGARR